MKKIFLCLTALLFIACGSTEPKTVIAKGKVTGKGPPQNSRCPATAPESFHNVTVRGLTNIPSRVAVVIDNILEVDECTVREEFPPIVNFLRFDAATINFVVRHTGAYSTPPQSISFRILDMGDCKVPGKEYFRIDNLPLTFTREAVGGPTCAARYVGTGNHTVPPVQP
jgi:hypothetical protein